MPQHDTPARAPSDYTLPQGFLGEEVSPEAVTYGRAIQSLLWSADVPAHQGRALLHSLKEAERRLPADMDDAAFELHARQTECTLRKVLGDSEYDRQRGALTALLARLNTKVGGKLEDLIGDHAHALLDPMVMMQLMQHAGRADKRKR